VILSRQKGQELKWCAGLLIAEHRRAAKQSRKALRRLELLWDELFPSKQARIVRLLVERVEVSPTGADVRLRVAGLASLVRDLGGVRSDEAQRAA